MTAATLPRPFHAPVLTRVQARLANALARRRDPVAAAGCEILFVPAPDRVEDPVRFALWLGGEAGLLTVPRRLLRRVLDGLDPAAAAAGSDSLCLLLELALEPDLARLEAAAPPLSVELHPAPDQMPQAARQDGLALGLRCRDALGEGFALRLDLGEAAARAVTGALHATRGRRRALPGLAVPVRVRALATDLPLAMLRALRHGDVILAASPRPGVPGGLLLVAGERICWRADQGGRGLVVVSPRLDARAAGLGEWMMTDDTPAPALDGPRLEGPRREARGPDGRGPDGGDAHGPARPALADESASLDELPVRLVFELGRLEVPLAELEAIGPGHVFDLARDEEQPVDIVAHGRRIGRGRIVAVGDSLGVQVVWIGRDG